MTSKLSWILFIPFTAAAVFFKLAQTLMAEGSIFGLSNLVLDYVVIGCAAMIFLFALIMCIADREISPYYQPHRNIPAGIFGLLLAVVFAADGANRIYLLLSSGAPDALEIVEAVLLLLSSIVLIVVGLTHSFVNRDNKNFALFNVMPALLCAIRLVRCFIGITTISLKQADITLMFCYVFATLFFFNFAVTISMTGAKNAVKSCFIFGLPAAAMLLARGAYGAVTSFDTTDLFANAEFVELLLAAVYITAFLIELSIFSKDKAHVTAADEVREYEELDEEEPSSEDDYIVTAKDEGRSAEPESSYLTTADVSDYLYHPVESVYDGDESDNGDYSGYITNVVKEQTVQQTPVVVPEAAVSEATPTDYTSRLDEIDKLILELTQESDD